MTSAAREPFPSMPDADALLAFSEGGVSRACRLHERALALRAERRTAEAEELARQALTLLTLILGPNDPDVANVILCLGGLREDTGDLAMAERLYRYALQILEKATDQDMSVIRLRVQNLGLLANLRQARGRYAASERLYRRVLAFAEEHLPADDLDLASLLNGLGILHKYQGRYDDAEPVYRRALAILEAAFGPGHPELASLYHNLGGLEHARGRAADGEPWARLSVEVREKALGPDHPDVAADKAALAALLDAQGKLEEAEALYAEALAVFERVYGPEHYEIAINFNNLAAIRQARGDAGEAEDLYRRALSIKEKALGEEHPDTALTVYNLATLLDGLGRIDEAEALYERASATFTTALGAGHPHTRICREALTLLRGGVRAPLRISSFPMPPPDLSFRPLAEHTSAEAAAALTRSFEGYLVPLQMTAQVFERRFRGEDLDPFASRVVYAAAGGSPVGVVLVARRGWTSRIAAMGLAPEARGQGLGRRLLSEAVEKARARGDRAVYLEVIEQNTPALRLYTSCGFQALRRLVGYRKERGPEEEAVPDTDDVLSELDPLELSRIAAREGEPGLPWMLASETLSAASLPARAVHLDGKAFALLADPAAETLQLSALVVPRADRRQGLGSRLVRALEAAFPGRALAMSAIVPEDLAPDFFPRLGWERGKITQFEMRLDL